MQGAMTKRELLEELECMKDDDLITFGNQLKNGKMLTFYRLKLRDSRQPNIYNFEFNEMIVTTAAFDD